MAKIMLFGSSTIFGVPQEAINWLQEYINQGHEFIVGDCKGADTAFHKTLSSLGATKVTIYSMDEPRNNTYEYPVKKFVTGYNEETKQVEIVADDNSTEPFIIEGVEKAMDIPHNRQWYEFKDKQMIDDCDIAIGLWDGKSKGTLHVIQLMNIYNKPCYTFTMEV